MSTRSYSLRLKAALIVAISASAAFAHEAPMGWTYDYSCCSNRDCRQDDEAVRLVKEGWLVLQTGEVVPWGDARLKDSPDGLFHICMSAGDFTSKDARVLCIYVPPMGF